MLNYIFVTIKSGLILLEISEWIGISQVVNFTDKTEIRNRNAG